MLFELINDIRKSSLHKVLITLTAYLKVPEHSIEVKDTHGRTLLSIATYYNRLEIVELLLEKGANIESTTDTGQTALNTACEQGLKSLAQFLLDKGANIEASDWWGDTPLIAAVKNGYFEIILLLIKYKSNIHKINNDGRGVVDTAAQQNRLDLVEFFINQNASVEPFFTSKQADNIQLRTVVYSALTKVGRLIPEGFSNSRRIELGIAEYNDLLKMHAKTTAFELSRHLFIDIHSASVVSAYLSIDKEVNALFQTIFSNPSSLCFMYDLANVKIPPVIEQKTFFLKNEPPVKKPRVNP